MIFKLESLATELFLELFNYLSPFDLLRAFTGLNHRLENIINFHSFRLDFRSISRSKFDFICKHVKTEQIVSLVLSEEEMPDQVILFLNHFPNFQQQFTRLQQLKLIDIDTNTFNLPSCVSSLSIIRGVKYFNHERLVQQANSLIYLRAPDTDVFSSIKVPLHTLTRLTIDCSTFPEINDMIERLQSPISHLKMTCQNYQEMEKDSLPNLKPISQYLKHLSVHFSSGFPMSFDMIENWLGKLSKLTHLTLSTHDDRGNLHVLDGAQWERIAKRLQLVKFYFRFEIFIDDLQLCNKHKHILKPFRSPFWLKEKRWFVACYYNQFACLVLYSTPHFRPDIINLYPEQNFQEFSTVPQNLIQHILYDTNIKELEYYDPKPCQEEISSPKYRYTQIETLTFYGEKAMQLDHLAATVDLSRLKNILIASRCNLSIDEINLLLAHTTQLECIELEYDSEFIPPLHVRSYKLDRQISDECIVNSKNIDAFCRVYAHIERLQVEIESLELLFQLIDGLEKLEHLETGCMMYDIDYEFNYLMPFEQSDWDQWYLQNKVRLSEYNITCRYGHRYIEFAIGDRLTCIRNGIQNEKVC